MACWRVTGLSSGLLGLGSRDFRFMVGSTVHLFLSATQFGFERGSRMYSLTPYSLSTGLNMAHPRKFHEDKSSGSYPSYSPLPGANYSYTPCPPRHLLFQRLDIHPEPARRTWETAAG